MVPHLDAVLIRAASLHRRMEKEFEASVLRQKFVIRIFGISRPLFIDFSIVHHESEIPRISDSGLEYKRFAGGTNRDVAQSNTPRLVYSVDDLLGNIVGRQRGVRDRLRI